MSERNGVEWSKAKWNGAKRQHFPFRLVLHGQRKA
uniref:Uncharacterized protein n=1 Tax=Vitis vinifera TaxID=29760 RepID=F6HT78_VITVI